MNQYAATELTPSTVPRDPGDGYKLVHNLIFWQVHSFKRQFGGIVDELICEANLTFVKSHNQFITGKTPKGEDITDDYASHIRHDVFYRLFDSMRLKVRRKHLAEMVSIEDIGDIIYRNDFDIFQLSIDARFVVALILDPPDEITTNAEKKGGEFRNYRSAVRSFLRKQKWSEPKIEGIFKEIISTLR